MKILTKEYCRYAEVKSQKDWPPNMIEEERDSIKKKVIQLEKEVEKGIMEIMKFVEDAAKKAVEDAKKVNHDTNLEKLFELIS